MSTCPSRRWRSWAIGRGITYRHYAHRPRWRSRRSCPTAPTAFSARSTGTTASALAAGDHSQTPVDADDQADANNRRRPCAPWRTGTPETPPTVGLERRRPGRVCRHETLEAFGTSPLGIPGDLQVQAFHPPRGRTASNPACRVPSFLAPSPRSSDPGPTVRLGLIRFFHLLRRAVAPAAGAGTVPFPLLHRPYPETRRPHGRRVTASPGGKLTTTASRSPRADRTGKRLTSDEGRVQANRQGTPRQPGRRRSGVTKARTKRRPWRPSTLNPAASPTSPGRSPSKAPKHSGDRGRSL